MNNNIQEPYCSFEVSKLLRQRGCEIITQTHYNERLSSDEKYKIINEPVFNYLNLCDLPRPTHQIAVEWIRVNFGIQIEIHGWKNQPVADEIWKEAYQAFVDGDAMDVTIFKTPQEATEAALLYTLQNLIK